ncbi:MAG: radical SAM protein, partial [Oscillospiraceae bacterium]|nr:radical SAM protein [Oscillospiraceae bacterium]
MRGLYIHVPFCLRKCPYCDFYSVSYDEGLAGRYARAVVRNIRAYGGEFDSVYFGGGTPILAATKIGGILGAVIFTQNAEITVECNPCEMTEETLQTLLEAGVNRLSVGVQSLDDRVLEALGRRHDARTAENAIITAKKAGFGNISADIMLATPRQLNLSPV